jgi:hypothetical protein
MNISEKQNNSINFKRLAAQKQLYSEAKTIHYLQIMLSGVMLLIISVLANVISKEYNAYLVLASILCVVFDELIINPRIEESRTLAASIQEDFDCDVLDIPLNKVKFKRRDLSEIVNEYSSKYLHRFKDFNTLIDWYPGMENTDTIYSKVICQKTNCWWSQKLREKYSGIIKAIIVFISIILIIISLLKGMTVEIFIVYVISPLMPISVLAYRIIRDNSKSIENLNDIKIILESIIEKLKNKEVYLINEFNNDVRCLQDMIYENRRISPVVPDFFYKHYRNRYEDTANETNIELIKLINTKSERC